MNRGASWDTIRSSSAFHAYEYTEEKHHENVDRFWKNPSSETQGQSVGSGEKAGRKFSLRAKEPLGTDSHWTFQTASSLPHLNYDLSKTEHSQGKFNIALADSNQNVFSTHR